MTHSRLRDLQVAFQEHVLHGDTEMLALISADVRPNPAARLAIYAHAYRLRLLEALETDFPALHTLAGDALFEQLGRAYIDAHPSTHFSIRYFARHLSAFLADTAPFRNSPVLAEMAALEWTLTLAFDAADDAVFNEATFAALPPEHWPGMRLHLHASVHWHEFRWNVAELWSAIDQQRAPEPPAAYPQPRTWLIWRRGLQTYFRPLERSEACALECLRAGKDFAAVCSALCEYTDPSQVGGLAAGYLKTWAAAGLIAGIC